MSSSYHMVSPSFKGPDSIDNQGWCKSGARCSFTHGTSDKRQVTGGGAEVSAGAGTAASTREWCKFFAKGMCMRGKKCIFVHSRDAAEEGYQPKKFADERPTKRLAPGTQTSPRPVPHLKPPWVSHGARTEASAGVRGRRVVQEFRNESIASPATCGGGGGGDGDVGGSSSHAETGERGSSAWPWQPPPNDENSGYFFEGNARLGGAGAEGAVPRAAPARRVAGSWHNVATSSTGHTQAASAREFSSARALIASAAAESARFVSAVQAGMGSALAAPRTGKLSKPCAFFVAGRCAFGDKCVNSHDNFRDQEEEEEEEEEGPGGAGRLGYGEEGDEEEEDEWASGEALDEAERIQSPRTAAAEKAAEAESARSVAAVQAGVGAALSAPRTGKVSKPCAFFVAGRCAFGDKCVYSHDNFRDQEAAEDVGLEEEEEEEGSGGAERLGYGEEEEEEEEDEWAAREAALDEAERIQSRRAECGVCLEKIRDRFGILVNCRHVYCLQCIKDWRKKSEDHECPQCRMPSHFVVPSATLVTDPERKELLVSAYQESLSTIPCRHFEHGVSECPFGSSCFYAHLKGDGTPAYSGRPRAILPESGGVRVGGGGGGVGGEARREVLMQMPSFVDLTTG